MGQKKWLETEQSVSDILKLKPGLDFDQEEKEMRIQRIMNLAAFNGKKESIGFGNFLVRQISYTGWKIWLAQGIFVAVFWILFFGSRASDMAEIARLIGRNLPFFFGMIAVAQVMILIPFLERSFRYQMYEMECATRFSCSGMLGACLIYGTIGIVGIFGLCMAFAAGYKNVSRGSCTLFSRPAFCILQRVYGSSSKHDKAMRRGRRPGTFPWRGKCMPDLYRCAGSRSKMCAGIWWTLDNLGRDSHSSFSWNDSSGKRIDERS